MYFQFSSTVIVLVLIQIAAVANQRPLWIIGHMVNSEGQIEYFLDLGANAVEADLSFTSDGTINRFFHGLLCDCFRNCFRSTTFDIYISYARKLSSPNDPKFRSNFVLLMLDLKLSKVDSSGGLHYAGTEVANGLLEYLWLNGTSDTQLRVHLSIPDTKYLEFINGFKKTLNSKGFGHLAELVGYEVSSYENIVDIVQAFRELGVKNIWQPDGATNCLPRLSNRLDRAVSYRDDPQIPEIKKVYAWSVDRYSTIRTVLELDADGIMSNRPDHVLEVLQDQTMLSLFRLATAKDDPYEKFVRGYTGDPQQETSDIHR